MKNPQIQKDEYLPREVRFAAAQGWHMFPVKAGDKIPLVNNWQNIATDNSAQLQAWAEQSPGCNWGVATGPDSGIFVLDVDGDDGSKALSYLQHQYQELPKTLEASTGRGRHLYFRCPKEKAVRNSASRLGKGLDIRGEGGFVVIPPSVHSSGKVYAFEDQNVPIADAPHWLLDSLWERNSPLELVSNPTGNQIPKGKRNSTLIRLAGTMRSRGMSPNAIEAALLEENRQSCNPPLPENEVQGIAESIMRYHPDRVFLQNEDPVEWSEPESMKEVLPDVAHFDLDTMPESLRPLVKDVAERMQVPLDFPAVAAIATLAGVTNRRAVIQPKRRDTTWIVVPNLWGGIIAPPGMLKSPVISSMTRPALAIENEWRNAFDEEVERYEAAFELQDEEIRAWKAQYQRAAKTKNDRPAKPQSALVKPMFRRLITSDATFESLHEVMSENPAGLFVVRDELTGWLAGLERQGREQERAFYLECWNGDAPFTIDRIGRGSVHVPHACISLFGGIQPARLRAYLADALHDGPSNDGLIQRFQLLIWPDMPHGWAYVDRIPDREALDRAALVYRNITALDAEAPLRLQFEEDAQVLFEQWLTNLEQRIHGEHMPPPMQAHLAKYRSLMPSLALLFALADGHMESVPLEHAQMAIGWCAYLESHALRVYASQARPEQAAAIVLSKRLANGWKREEGSFSLRDVYRNGWTDLDSTEKARRALQILEDFGWVRQIEETAFIGRPSETYLINPHIKAKHSKGHEGEEREVA